MMPDFEVSPFHKLIIDYLDFLLNRHIRKLAIITPPAYARGRNPTETIIGVSSAGGAIPPAYSPGLRS
jgi:hypothetical protein